MRWLRLYNEIIDDPKIGLLKDREFRLFIEILCIASQQSDTGSTRLTHEQITWRLRRGIKSSMTTLLRLKLVEEKIENGEKIIWVKNWEKRQFSSDSSYDRVKRYREKKRDCNVSSPLQKQNCNVLDTDTDTETDTETEKNKTSSSCLSFSLNECDALISEQTDTKTEKNEDLALNEIKSSPVDSEVDPRQNHYPPIENGATLKSGAFLQGYLDILVPRFPSLGFCGIKKKTSAMFRAWESEGVTPEDVAHTIEFCETTGKRIYDPGYYAEIAIDFCRDRKKFGEYQKRGAPEEEKKSINDEVEQILKERREWREKEEGAQWKV